MPDALDRQRFDLAIVGGGLQGALLALAWLVRRPEARIALIEREAEAPPERTWCFHATDLPAEARPFVEPLIEHRWSGTEVRFPGLRRQLPGAYLCFTSARARRVLAERFSKRADCAWILGRRALAVEARRVRLDDGRELAAELIVDATGGSRESTPTGSTGYQKFLGLELELARDHELALPVVMDACVDQREGYRFFYALPFGPRRILLEDTRFADTPRLERAELRREVLAHAERLGLAVARIAREEEGVLPMPWAGQRFDLSGPPLRAGTRGGWYHAATGYSFPLAVRLALLTTEVGVAELFARALPRLARAYAAPARHARFLNRLLFRWFAPRDRVHVLERFYRSPAPAIARFYALRATWFDRARILVGRPPRGFSLRARLGAAARAQAAPSEVAHV
jgi:lycopene beta-cyclase